MADSVAPEESFSLDLSMALKIITCRRCAALPSLQERSARRSGALASACRADKPRRGPRDLTGGCRGIVERPNMARAIARLLSLLAMAGDEARGEKPGRLARATRAAPFQELDLLLRELERRRWTVFPDFIFFNGRGRDLGRSRVFEPAFVERLRCDCFCAARLSIVKDKKNHNRPLDLSIASRPRTIFVKRYNAFSLRYRLARVYLLGAFRSLAAAILRVAEFLRAADRGGGKPQGGALTRVFSLRRSQWRRNRRAHCAPFARLERRAALP